MKNKLKKDLKFLRTWKGKLGASLAVSFLSVLIAGGLMKALRSGDDLVFFIVIVVVIAYIALYFFNAWLVGDEEDNKSSNVEN